MNLKFGDAPAIAHAARPNRFCTSLDFLSGEYIDVRHNGSPKPLDFFFGERFHAFFSGGNAATVSNSRNGV
jgi:hypothetical protein